MRVAERLAYKKVPWPFGVARSLVAWVHLTIYLGGFDSMVSFAFAS